MRKFRIAVILLAICPISAAQQPPLSETRPQPTLSQLVESKGDAAAALQAAADAGPVLLPAGTLRISKPIVLKSGATLRGRASTIQAIGSVQGGLLQIAEGAEGVHLEGLHLDSSLSHTGIRIGKSSRVTIENCKFTGSLPHTNFLVDIDEGAMHVTVIRSSFTTARSGVRIRGATRNIRVAQSTFRQWLDYGVLIRGTPKAGPTSTTIEDCDFAEPSPGTGGARQMVVAYSETKKPVTNITGLKVIGNLFEGPGGYYDRVSDTSTATADQLAVTSCREFVLANNISLNGGENGITVSLNSTRGVVTGNIARANDGHGIQVGSRNDSESPDCRAIVVTGNNCSDNGKRLDPKAADTMANIYIQDAADINLSANSCTSYSVPHNVAYGINIAESSRIQLSVDNHVHFADPEGTTPVAIFSSTTAKRWEPFAPQPQTKPGPARKSDRP